MLVHPAAKAIVAAAVAVLTTTLIAIGQLIPMSATAHGWVAVGLAFLGAAGTATAVYYQGNTPDAPTPTPTSAPTK